MKRFVASVVLAVALPLEAFAAASPSLQPSVRVPVLMFHHIRDDRGSGAARRLSVTTSSFGKLLSALKGAGFHSATFLDLSAGTLPDHPVILTFDDGYDDAFTNAFPALNANGFTGVFFIVSGKVGTPGYVTEADLRTMLASGMELGAHTKNHRDLSRIPVTDQQTEIGDSIRYLEETFSIPVVSFAYPSGKYSSKTLRLLSASGILYAVTTHHGVALPFGAKRLLLPRIRVEEKTSVSALLKSLK